MSHSFQIVTLSPGLLSPSIPIATSRAGGLGVLDFEFIRTPEAAAKAISQLNDARVAFGIKLCSDAPGMLGLLASDLPPGLKTVILTSGIRAPGSSEELRNYVRLLREKGVTTLLEARCLDDAQAGTAIEVDGLVAKGHEAGGRVGDETTFILLQRFHAAVRLPVWAYGGIGLHTAGACVVAGAAGLIVDAQLALTRESPFPEAIKARIARMDGSETICLGERLGEKYRIYFRPGDPAVRALQQLEAGLENEERTQQEILAEWRRAITERAGWESEENALLLGQDAAFAAPLAQRYCTVGGLLQAMREAIRTHCDTAERLRPLAERSPLARSHGTRYPILQGPMTRVSDVPEFAGRVAEGGALPFLALALMRGAEVKALLAETQQRLAGLPWGVGILGFVPPALRQEQLEVIGEYRPPFALIAGGRPDQSQTLEERGIATYLHVPSLGLLEMFIQQGARRFVFEGRECGGHVGPRTSFVLWNQMVDVLLAAPELETAPEEFHVVFAAGIHDALSAAMVSVIAAPLAARGVRVGVLLGTAYLFTEEAVTSGAIQRTFQAQGVQCQQTVLLETGPGHATRCVATPYAETFSQEKQRLFRSGATAEEIRVKLEELNLGRLRIASKGVTRHSGFAQDPAAPKLIEVDESEQLAQGMYMIGQVAALRDTVCTVEALHHSVSTEGSERLAGIAERTREEPLARRAESPSDIAIIGMACLLPKAPDLETFWDNILHKFDAVGEVPEDRWNPELYFDPDPKAKDKIYSKWGGFLEEVPFDPMQYGMPPASLRSIEPAQLLTLVVVRAALKDAGYLERPFARERTSVILGAGGGAADLGLSYGARAFIPVLENLPEFRGRSREILDRMGGRLPEWTEDSFAGILTNVSAGRVANRFDLGGSNFTVDAACASSLAAVSVALRELESQTSDMVIVGGVDTMQNPFTYLCFSKTKALSPRGKCRTFDEGADGIAISEGIAMMVLKRLADAERDGDRIYAVIKGAGSASDGKDRGLTAPRPEGQARALRRAYAKAGISPATIGLIEAHGTGTVAGDGAEVQALTQVFSEAHAAKQSCAIGSVKSMIGHTKCTAGAVGLMKTALALHHKMQPPTLGVQKPNPRARFSETPFFVNSEPRPWIESANGYPRRAGVSAFGFGGTNFHAVLEEYTGDPVASRTARCQRWSDELFLWRSDSRQGLLEAVVAWDKALASQATPALRDLAFTAWKDAQHNPTEGKDPSLQLAIVAASLDDLRQKLGWARQSIAQPEASRIQDPRGIYFSEQMLATQGKLAFLFPGQGSQYPHMLQDLLIYFPETQQVFERAVGVLRDQMDLPLSTYVFPPPSFSPEEAETRQKALTQTRIAQPALGAAGLAMFGLLQELGLKPDMLAGHSYGEYVALAAAGVFSTEALIALSEARGRYIVEAAGDEPGVMAAIDAEAGTVAAVLRSMDGVSLANANAPRQTVISGTRAGVERAVEQFAAQGIVARKFPVACAFHSRIVSPSQERLAQFLSTLKMARPGITVYSNTTAEPYPEDPEAVAARLVEHLVRPVEFVREIEAMYAAGARIFVEVGPRGILTSLVEKILGDRPKLAAASNQQGRPGLTQLLHLLGQLAAQGVALKLDRLYRDRFTRRLELSALERESGEEQLAPSVWMVNGAHARPLNQSSARNGYKKQAPKAAYEKQEESVMPRSSPPVATPPRAAHVFAPHAAATPTAARLSEPVVTSVSSDLATFVPASLDDAPKVMAQFQQTMSRFLETQKIVTLTYLGAAAGMPAVESLHGVETSPKTAFSEAAFIMDTHAVERPRQMDDSSLEQPVPTILTSTSGTSSASISPSDAVDRPDISELTARLLSIVSERTGYPAEMLDPQLDLEADLGIDSIKRVEILGTLQQSLNGAGKGADGMMETLAGIRTLAGIVNALAEYLSQDTAKKTAAQEAAGGGSRKYPDVPATAIVLNREELTVRLLQVVSERTGYPPEMLGLDLDIEADLGIDSIKRVEILGNFQQSFASAGATPRDGLMEQLAGVRTLRSIIDRVIEQQCVGLKAELSELPSSAQELKETAVPTSRVLHADDERDEKQNGDPDGERIRRFTVVAVETPLEGRLRRLSKERTILITDDGHGVASVLADKLRERGHKVALVRQGQTVQESGQGCYTANLTLSAAAAELIALVSKLQGPLGGVVHLSSLREGPSFSMLDHAGWRERTQLGAKSLFHLAKAAGNQLREAGEENRATLIAATGMGGCFLTDLGVDARSQSPNLGGPDQGGVVGLIKTVALEWPEVRVKAVDLNLAENAQALAEHLFDELNMGDEHAEVGYDAGRRVTLEPRLAPLHANAPPTLELDQSSVLLITGGARGIAALAAHRFAERYRPTLILVGRSLAPSAEEAPETAAITSAKELKAALMEQIRSRGDKVTPALVEQAYARLNAAREIRSNLSVLRGLGARVEYHCIDVRDAEAFSTFIDEIYRSFGRLDGVLHAAGVIEDKLVADKTPESFERVFDTKVDSAFVLSRKLHPESLKFLVFFSSVAGRLGNRGQGDYAAANEVLNKMAVCLDRAWPSRVVAIDWGPWDSPGMVSVEVRKQFAERGVDLIPPATGVRMLEEELNSGRRGEAEVILAGGGWQPIRRRHVAQTFLPLIASPASPRPDGSRDFVRKFDPGHDLYLQDHRLDGQPVLPLAVATELIAEAAVQDWPGMEVSAIRNLRVLHGIVIDDGTKSTRVLTKLAASTEPDGASFTVEVFGVEQSPRIHYSAIVELVRQLPQVCTLQPPPLVDGRIFPMPVEQVYQKWLFHGPLLQGIERIDCVCSGGIRAVLAKSSPGDLIAGAQGQWLIDPLMFDSGLQLLVLWARHHWDMTALPSGFQSYRRYADSSSEHILCEMRIRPETGGQVIHADLFFHDAESGRVAGVIEDMQGACSKSLNRLAGGQSLVAVGGGS